MPYLFCAEHGREEEAECEAEQENYLLLGEAVLVVTGSLISGPWRCDRCDGPLKKGEPAFVVTGFSHHFASDLAGYDYSYERRYFSMREVRAAAYGAGPKN